MFQFIGLVVIIIAVLAILGFDAAGAWSDYIHPAVVVLWNFFENVFFWILDFVVAIVLKIVNVFK